MFVAGALALCGLGSVGAGAAAAAPGYRLEFGSTAKNAASAGPLIIKGHRSSTAEPMTADQVIERAGGGTTTRSNIGQLVYEEYPGSHSHRHWHYKGFVRYQLRSTTSDRSLVRPDNKTGFCLSDPAYALDFCGSLKPDALSVDEGLSPGAADYYYPHFEGQYIDVADVPPGDYWLVHWVNAGKEICESNYENNASAVKITLWPNGYGVAPYFKEKEAVEPFLPPLYSDPTPPADCDPASTPTPKLPDLSQKHPTELSVAVVGGSQEPPVSAPPQTGQPAPTPAEGPPTPAEGPPSTGAPALTEKLARRYVVRALTKRLHRRPATVRQACRRLSATRFRCRVRGRYLTYRFSGSVQIFTIRVPDGFEPRASLRVRRTNTRCAPGRRCSRTLTARNIRF